MLVQLDHFSPLRSIQYIQSILSFSIKRRRSESYINYPALTQAKLCTQRLSVMLSILQIKIDLVFRFGFEESSNRLIGYRTR